MTREEARLTLQENFGYLSEEHPRIIEAMRVAINILSVPSLPSNLDEAAEEYSRKKAVKYYGNTFYAFKAGAEWMAGQGYTVEGVARPDDCEVWVNLTGTDIKDGEEVIAQIRKK